MSKVAVFCALKEERQAVRKAWDLRPAGSVRHTEIEQGEGVICVCTGVGPERVSLAVERVRRIYDPELFLLVGYSAGLKPSLKVGDLVADPKGNEALLDRLQALFPRLKVASVASCGFLNSAREKAELAERMEGSLVADLESQDFLAAVGCSQQSLVLRAVSDTVDTDLPLPFEKFLNNQGFPEPMAIARAAFTRPVVVPSLLRLARDSARATESLSQALQVLAPLLRAGVHR